MSEHVKDVKKRGDWYVVKGVSGGREVSVDIPANQIDGKSRDKAHELFQKGLKTVAEN